ncbi:hypothetical protein H0H93_003648, partial [Arthromyces matolae]
RVAKAAKSVLGTTAVEVVHELLFTTVNLLENVPLPGLAPAAKVLLQIWETLQAVEVRVGGFLRSFFFRFRFRFVLRALLSLYFLYDEY